MAQQFTKFSVKEHNQNQFQWKLLKARLNVEVNISSVWR